MFKKLIVVLGIVAVLGCAQLGDFFGGFMSNPVVVAVLNECGELPAVEFDPCAIKVLNGLVDPNEASIADYLKLAQEIKDAMPEKTDAEEAEVEDDASTAGD